MYLIDTDILIYSLKGQATVVDTFAQKADYPKSISVISFSELIYGAHKSANASRNIATARRVGAIFPVVQVDKAIGESFGELKAVLEQAGNRMDDFDLAIAATALVHDLILVTNNTKHFQRIPGLNLENWAMA